MATPILLVSGYLGAGKTTLVNRLLTEADGRRIAAIVNDFGAIDIDAALLSASSDGVVSLKNGCICCSLQGDLLRALATVMRIDPKPEAIVIETSGVSDPGEIARNLLDPVIFKAAALDAVLTLVDARHLADDASLADDPLWLAQLRAADFLLITKADLVDAGTLESLRARIARIHPRAFVFAGAAELPGDVLFSQRLHDPVSPAGRTRPVAAPAFETMSWTSASPLSLRKFQRVLGEISGRLLRAKGIVVFAELPGRPMLVQIVAGRATIAASPTPPGAEPRSDLVLIARSGGLDAAAISELLHSAVAS